MPGPNGAAQGAPQERNDDLRLDELTQEIDAPLADLSKGQDDATLSTLDFEDIENALDW
jgi:hypothetical protein